MSKTFSFIIVLGLFTILLVSCGTNNPSVKLDDLKFYITNMSVSDSTAGYSQITIELIAENAGKNPVPFPNYSDSHLVGGVALQGKVGNETYTYGATQFSQFENLPPHFRSKYTFTFEVAKTATDLKLMLGIYELLPFSPKTLAEGSIRVNLDLSGKLTQMSVPVDSDNNFSSLGTTTTWCPNTILSIDGLKRIDFGIDSRRFTGIILDFTFINNSGDTLSPNCPNIKATLFANSGMVFDKPDGIIFSTNLDTPPGLSTRGKIFLGFEQLPTDIDLDNSWLSIRRYTLDWSFFVGYKVLDDVQIVYEIPSISILPFSEFSSSGFDPIFEYYYPRMIP